MYDNILTCNDPVLKPYPIANKWDGKTWLLDADWHIIFRNKRIQLELWIKRGFVTDGGSIPQWYQNVVAPLGIYLMAFLAHDALYATEYLSRAECDRILSELIQALGGNWWRRNTIWAAVRLGGGAVWSRHTVETIAAARRLVSGNYQTLDGKTGFEFGMASA